MSFSFKVVASLPPAIMMVIGAFLVVLGSATASPELFNVGVICIILGVLLQVLFLACRRGPR